MTKTVHGVVHGKTIELDEELGVSEGQEVEVEVRIIPKTTRKPGEGFLRTEGALADDTEWDAIMEEIYRARKLERRSEIPDLGDAHSQGIYQGAQHDQRVSALLSGLPCPSPQLTSPCTTRPVIRGDRRRSRTLPPFEQIWRNGELPENRR